MRIFQQAMLEYRYPVFLVGFWRHPHQAPLTQCVFFCPKNSIIGSPVFFNNYPRHISPVVNLVPQTIPEIRHILGGIHTIDGRFMALGLTHVFLLIPIENC
jgi:hypothetical protein